MKTPQCKKYPCNCHNGPQNKKQHTPTPWHMYQGSGGNINAGSISVHGKEGDCLAVCNGVVSPNAENAAFIVRAVNSHEALLNVLSKAKMVVERMDAPSYNRLAEAIEQAEGK